MRRSVSWWKRVILGGAFATAGCAGFGMAYVETGPPVEVVEVRSASPDPSYVWIGGHWAWESRDYHWVNGHWARPLHPGWGWEPGVWVHEDRGWGWREGHWRKGGDGHDEGRGRGQDRDHDHDHGRGD